MKMEDHLNIWHKGDYPLILDRESNQIVALIQHSLYRVRID